MTYKTEVTKEVLDKLFDYCPISGSVKNKKTQKDVKLTDDPIPRICFRYNKKAYALQLHLVVWCLVYGTYPETDRIIFHRDFNQRNIKISNLMQVKVVENYALLSAYKNLTLYCDIKVNQNDRNAYSVRYLSNKRLKHEKYDDYAAAQKASAKLKQTYKRLIIKYGAIPPI